jgi:hypothetical protein
MSTARISRTARPARGAMIPARLFACLAAALLTLATLRGGVDYVFCSSMGEVVSRACCDVHVHPRDDGAPEISAGDRCCSIHTTAAVPDGTPGRAGVTPSQAPQATLRSFPPVVATRVLPAVPRPLERSPTGPPRPSDIPRRTRVLLI